MKTQIFLQKFRQLKGWKDLTDLCGKAVKCFRSSGTKGLGTQADVSTAAAEAETAPITKNIQPPFP